MWVTDLSVDNTNRGMEMSGVERKKEHMSCNQNISRTTHKRFGIAMR